MKVQCSDLVMTVTLTTTEPFEGRMYVSGHAETCGVHGVGKNVTVLKLPLPRKELVGKSMCGLTIAYSADHQNRYTER